jgi:hypothetical protein
LLEGDKLSDEAQAEIVINVVRTSRPPVIFSQLSSTGERDARTTLITQLTGGSKTHSTSIQADRIVNARAQSDTRLLVGKSLQVYPLSPEA